MSYQVLARKWRPNTFSEVIGQNIVVDTLTNSIKNQKLHHAYLFTGTRGTGKTTLARLMAKAINCEEGLQIEPCQVCSACVGIKAGNFIDLIEIDAASRTKVEDTREILENVRYQPSTGRFKVYIIDEVHMLSNSSFNALLKTLEEPPEYVKFFLATTDPQKLPITVLSRCIQLHLININASQIAKHLQVILKEEKVKYEEEAILQISDAADGSMRDALSLTDQLIAQSDNNIKLETVLQMLGTFSKGKIFKLLTSILQNDQEKSFAILEEMNQQAPNYLAIVKDLSYLIYDLAIALEFSQKANEKHTELLEQSQLEQADLQILYQMTIVATKQIPLAPTNYHGFAMLLLRIHHYLRLKGNQSAVEKKK